MPPGNLFVDCTTKKEDHVDLNKLRVRLATLRDACLAKLPPCEATFTQQYFHPVRPPSLSMSCDPHYR